MSDQSEDSSERVQRRSHLGDKRFHSESSLQHADGSQDEKDPGVVNPLSRRPSLDTLYKPGLQRPSLHDAYTPPVRRRERAYSQPSLVVQTAMATRAQRKRSVDFEVVNPSSRRPSLDTSSKPSSQRPSLYDAYTPPVRRRDRAYSQPSLVVQTGMATRTQRKRSVGFEVYNAQASTSTADAEFATRRVRTVSQPGPQLSTAAARRRARTVMYADQRSPKDPAKDGEDKLSFRLVLPSGAGSDSGSATPIGGRSSPLPNGNFLNGDAKSLNSYRLFASNADLRSVGTPTPWKRSQADVQSLRSVETQGALPTSAEDKSKMTRDYITLTMSVMYAVLLVTVGIILFVADPFLLEMSMSPIYCLYLVGVGFLYLVFLLIDIRIYLNTIARNDRVKEKHIESYEDFFKKQEVEFAGADGVSAEGTKTPQIPPPPPPGLLKQLDHNYCFSHGRHAGSFYLKMGAAGFALGHMVHSVLLLTTQFSYLLEEGYEDCLDYPQIVLDFLYPTYSFVQLFFIFKYSNVIILRHMTLARFGFMHFIGSSLCLWVWTIVRETVLSLTIYAQANYPPGYDDPEYNVMNGSRLDLIDLVDENCMGQPAINNIYSNFSIYLFPFSVEYNILIVGIFYIIWNNIGEHSTDDDDDLSSVYSGDTSCKAPMAASAENGYSSNFVIHADCHASNRGIFGGLIVMVLTIALLILGFVFSTINIAEFTEVAHLLNDSVKLSLHVVMLVTVVMAYNLTRSLDVNQHPVSLLDDILLFICIPAFFMETIFTMVATISITNIIKCTDVVVMAVQVVLQTSFLVDALRRCSNSRRLRRVKPARELVMFLLITNVAMWIFNTFSFKSPDSVDERYEYYGKVLWSILGHVSLPLIMFYRFHSSVCLADVWKSAYEPDSGH